ncbi:MAG: hypothetical protein IPQ28_12165 [Sphingobacteriales bacterium]|nr:hypothetical protein [Sphingobacteriales bacterium]
MPCLASAPLISCLPRNQVTTHAATGVDYDDKTMTNAAQKHLLLLSRGEELKQKITAPA